MGGRPGALHSIRDCTCYSGWHTEVAPSWVLSTGMYRGEAFANLMKGTYSRRLDAPSNVRCLVVGRQIYMLSKWDGTYASFDVYNAVMYPSDMRMARMAVKMIDSRLWCISVPIQEHSNILLGIPEFVFPKSTMNSAYTLPLNMTINNYSYVVSILPNLK